MMIDSPQPPQPLQHSSDLHRLRRHPESEDSIGDSAPPMPTRDDQLIFADGSLSLCFYNMHDHHIPATLFGLTRLRVLSLAYNSITTLPAAISKLVALEELNLGHNRLTTLPRAIGRLVKLRCLFLNSNQLTELPFEMASMVSLKVLNIANNGLLQVC